MCGSVVGVAVIDVGDEDDDDDEFLVEDDDEFLVADDEEFLVEDVGFVEDRVVLFFLVSFDPGGSSDTLFILWTVVVCVCECEWVLLCECVVFVGLCLIL